MKISVEKIKSEKGLLSIRQQVSASGNVWNATSLIIVETETGNTWESFGGFNGTPTDLWLRKKGTIGATSKTFIRASISSYSYMLSELTCWGIEVTPEFMKCVEAEKLQNEAAAANSLAVIKSFSDVERAKKWCSNDEGNSHKRRTRWANRAQRLGAERAYGNILRDKCYKMSNNG